MTTIHTMRQQFGGSWARLDQLVSPEYLALHESETDRYMDDTARILIETNCAAIVADLQERDIQHEYDEGWLTCEPTTAGRAYARELAAKLDSYPLLDEESFCAAEHAVLQEAWENYGRDEVERKIEQHLESEFPGLVAEFDATGLEFCGNSSDGVDIAATFNRWLASLD